MRFEWDPRKTAANLLKHGISFEEATTGLRDNLAITGRDPDHSTGETRYITFGVSSQGRLLVVAHTERGALIRWLGWRRVGGSHRTSLCGRGAEQRHFDFVGVIAAPTERRAVRR